MTLTGLWSNFDFNSVGIFFSKRVNVYKLVFNKLISVENKLEFK